MIGTMSAAALRVLIPSEQIQERVRVLGEQIDADYPEGPIYLISILKGSLVVLADLSRALKRHSVRIQFMEISSYGREKSSSRHVQVKRVLDTRNEGHQVLIVEDI